MMQTHQLHRAALIAYTFFATSTALAADPSACPSEKGVTVQVLGSGGPIADDARASSAYLIWIDRRARVLIDAGGGAFLRFGEAGAKFADLHFIGISHYHADHSADLPSLLKTGYFSGRSRSLSLAGPAGNKRFPGLGEYLNALLDNEHGAYAYLSGYLEGTGRLARLTTTEVPLDAGRRHSVYNVDAEGLQITGFAVPHGIVPSISYRVTIGGTSIVFASDQNGQDERFTDFAAAANLLIMHMAIPEDASGSAVALHARPSQIGAIAAAAAPKRVVISHLMARSLDDLDGNLDEITSLYGGSLDVATDLACYSLD